MSPEDKGGQCVELITFHFPKISGRSSRNSGILKRLEPQGPVQACNEIALPLSLLSKRAFGVGTQHVAKRLTQTTLTFQLFQTELKYLKET